mmetsp:Transcript_37035/g.88034  ORF Transcript_37035/g.88034 Transcript_37035/m.88034 type:complete len:387 (+) Transcript_37035:252-1412(+)
MSEAAEAPSSGGQQQKRRGRKRGKHNFETGYKDQLYEDWLAFCREHRRCPKGQEITQLSESAFEKRRAALSSEDPLHPHLSILEEPLDEIQVKNLVNNEKRRRARLGAQTALVDDEAVPNDACDGNDNDMPPPSGFRPPTGELGGQQNVKRRRKEYGLESEADSHSTVATAAATALQQLEAASNSFLPGLVGQGGSAEAVPSPRDHILKAALAACQQALQSQPSSQGASIDLQQLQENLKKALAQQLQNMSPQQQLSLWQQQLQLPQSQAYQLPQQAGLQQAVLAALTQQPSLAQALLQLPGLQSSVMHHNPLLGSLSALLPQQPPAGPLQAALGSLPFSSIAPATTSGAFSGAAAQQPPLAQVLQLMQMFQGQQQAYKPHQHSHQ